MFYCDDRAPQFLLGDVLKGFVLTSSHIKNIGQAGAEYQIELMDPAFCAVLSPCCSNTDDQLCLSPLVEVRGAFLDNPYWAEDLTLINRRLEPQQTVSPFVWQQLPDSRKQSMLNEGLSYTFYELFLYDQCDLFAAYTIHRKAGSIGTRYYMVDFRNTHKVHCPTRKIVQALLDAKVLQLSVEARDDLRKKIANYYGRIPSEDLRALAT